MIPPDDALKLFLSTFMGNNFGAAFQMFTKLTQDKCLEHTLNLLKQRNPEAVEVSGIGIKEVHIMFKTNEQSLVHTFWKAFYFSSGSQELYQFGHYTVASTVGNTAIVHAEIVYPNGQKGEVDLTMIKEGSAWKYGYIESGMKIS